MKINKIVATAGNITDRVISFLDTLPEDEIFTTVEIEEYLQRNFTNNGAFKSNRWRWKDYAHKVVIDGQLQYVWGSRKSIMRLRKELKSEEILNEN